jgi:uncharacterized protein
MLNYFSLPKVFSLFFILLFSFAFSFAMSVEDVKLTDYVTDYTNTLSTEQVLELSKILGEIEKEKGFQIAVVLVPDLSGDYIEHYAVKLYESIGLGTKEKDEVILRSPNEDEYYEVSGSKRELAE